MGEFHFTWPDVAMVALPTIAIVLIVITRMYLNMRYVNEEEDDE